MSATSPSHSALSAERMGREPLWTRINGIRGGHEAAGARSRWWFGGICSSFSPSCRNRFKPTGLSLSPTARNCEAHASEHALLHPRGALASRRKPDPALPGPRACAPVSAPGVVLERCSRSNEEACQKQRSTAEESRHPAHSGSATNTRANPPAGGHVLRRTRRHWAHDLGRVAGSGAATQNEGST